MASRGNTVYNHTTHLNIRAYERASGNCFGCLVFNCMSIVNLDDSSPPLLVLTIIIGFDSLQNQFPQNLFCDFWNLTKPLIMTAKSYTSFKENIRMSIVDFNQCPLQWL